MRRKTVQNNKCQRQRGARNCRVTRSSRTELQGQKRGSGRTGQQKRTPAVRGAPSNRSSPLSQKMSYGVAMRPFFLVPFLAAAALLALAACSDEPSVAEQFHALTAGV